MAKKYGPEIGQLQLLKEVNSKLVNHTDVYTIDHDTIFMKSSITFAEKYAFLHDKGSLSLYHRALIPTITTRGFLTGFRKTKTNVRIYEDKIEMRTDDTDEESYIINRISDDSNISISQIARCYTKLFSPEFSEYMWIISEEEVSNRLKDSWFILEQSQIQDLRENRLIAVPLGGQCFIYPSKGILGDIKSTEEISCARLPIEHPYKHYVLIKQVEKHFDLYTLVATIKQNF